MRAQKNITKIFSGHFEIKRSCHKDHQVFFQATFSLYLIYILN